MPIEFQCPNCNLESQVSEAFAGTSGPCRGCGQTISIPGNPFAAPMVDARGQEVPHEPQPADPTLKFLLPIDRSGLAIAAGYLGLFSVLCLPAPLAVILGVLALWDIKKSDGKKLGKGRAWFAIVMGSICILGPIIAMLLLP